MNVKSVILPLVLATSLSIAPQKAEAAPLPPEEALLLAQKAVEMQGKVCEMMIWLAAGNETQAAKIAQEITAQIRKHPATSRLLLQRFVGNVVAVEAGNSASAAAAASAVSWAEAALGAAYRTLPVIIASAITPWDVILPPKVEQPGFIAILDFQELKESWEAGEGPFSAGECDPDMDFKEFYEEVCDPAAPEELLEHLPDEQGPMGDPDDGIGETGTGPLGGWRPLDLDAWRDTVEISDPFDTEQLPNALVEDVWVELNIPVSDVLCWGSRQRWDASEQAWDVDSFEVVVGDCI